MTALGGSSTTSAQQRQRVTTGCCSRTNKKPARVLKVKRVSAKKQKQELPGGPVIKNPPANAGTQVQSWFRKVHMPQGT